MPGGNRPSMTPAAVAVLLAGLVWTPLACTIEEHAVVVEVPVEILDPAPIDEILYYTILYRLQLDFSDDGGDYWQYHPLDYVELTHPATVVLDATFVTRDWPLDQEILVGAWRDDVGDGEFDSFHEPCDVSHLTEPYIKDHAIPLQLVLSGCEPPDGLDLWGSYLEAEATW